MIADGMVVSRLMLGRAGLGTVPPVLARDEVSVNEVPEGPQR